MNTDPSGYFSLSESAIVQNGITVLSNLNFKYTNAVGAALFNALIQARLIALGVPLIHELDDLARTIQSVSPSGANKVLKIKGELENAVSAPNVFFNVYFPSFLASLPGKTGTGFSIAFSAYKLLKLRTFFESLVAEAAQGVSFNNGHSHYNITANVHPYKNGALTFGVFGLGGTGRTPALDVMNLNIGLKSLISGDSGGAGFWLGEFHRGISDYELDVNGEFGSSGGNYHFNGGFSYQQ